MRVRIAAFVLTALLGAQAPTGAQAGPVVVELFTSQGCSACPPADAALREFAQRPDVVALSLHVDYWDYLGWRDRLALPANTRRQRDYLAELGGRTVFTPQMVIDGRVSVVGSRRSEALDEIALAGARPDAVAVRIERDGSVIRATLTPQADASPASASPARILLVVYDHAVTEEIGGGENAGREVTYVNVAREWRTLGAWSGGAAEIVAPAPHDAAGVAILVQRAEEGVVGAGALDLSATPLTDAARHAEVVVAVD